MRKEFLTDEERAFLEEHLTNVIGLFKQAHYELVNEISNLKRITEYELEILNENQFLNNSEFAFMNGCCFYFARIMKTIFPEYTFVIECLKDYKNYPTHILLRKGDKFFDILYDENTKFKYQYYKNHPIKFYRDADDKDLKYARKKFAIIDDEIYGKLKYKFYRNIKVYLNKNYKLKTYIKK